MDGDEIYASGPDGDAVEGQPGRTAWLLLSGATWAVWALALAWLVLHVIAVVASPLHCPPYAGDGSTGGDAGWQWLPPGVTCTYYDDSGAAVVTWTPDFSLALLTILIVAIPLAVLARRRLSATA